MTTLNELELVGILLALWSGALVYFQYRHTKTATWFTNFNILTIKIEARRDDRAKIRRAIKKRKRNSRYKFNPKELKAVDRVCRMFDILGIMDRTGSIDSKMVDMFYSVPFVELYNGYLGEYVTKIRGKSKRGGTHFWELVQFYDRVKYVPDNHPAHFDKKKWPRSPRQRPKNTARL